MALNRYPDLPYLQQDLIPTGIYSNRTSFYAVGKATSVNNARVDLWEGGGSYVFPAAAIQMQVVSASANDAAAGTGVRTVIIHYLDNTYAVKSETVTLNGVTPVSTVATNILRVNGFHAASLGSGGSAAGTISLQAVGGGVTYSLISAGYVGARTGVFTIPAGKTGYIDHWNGSSGTASGTHYTQIDLRATCHEGVALPSVFILQDSFGTLNGGMDIALDQPIKIPATCDIKITTVSDSGAAGAEVIGRFSGWYE